MNAGIVASGRNHVHNLNGAGIYIIYIDLLLRMLLVICFQPHGLCSPCNMSDVLTGQISDRLYLCLVLTDAQHGGAVEIGDFRV